MRIGILKEIKNNENRVALPPSGVLELVKRGHEVWVETKAGLGSAIYDNEYENVGAVIKQSAQDVWSCELVLKVKEPLDCEYQYFREDLLLFTYLHMAANQPLAEALLAAKVNAIAYENVTTAEGQLPLLAPMSVIAGRMAPQLGARFLERSSGGEGILLAGVPGVKRGEVMIIGGGIAGTNAAQIAFGLGAKVTVLDTNLQRLQELESEFSGQIQTLASNISNLETSLITADLVIGAVLLPGHKAPKLVTREMVASMKEGAVIVDIAIDQGGIFETGDTVTTHDKPTYVKEGVIHYAVANMPGAVPQTSTYALSNATLPYILQLAQAPLTKALQTSPDLYHGVNTYRGKLTLKAVAEDLNLAYTPLDELL
ncbi:alanine dehydrogenase [Enterococcus asini]|uniref:alanine dehydrogenase n=1 Tax=Enterococcus asini TaxID=57732 RepID=UPI00288CFFF5|nr:alanine dehydrogenase [Enterococcus asini]MDT2756074.1 alanine dehydrogenase [Enterococcus asini]